VNARNAVVLFGVVAMLFLAKLPSKTERAASRLEQVLIQRPARQAIPVTYVPFLPPVARR